MIIRCERCSTLYELDEGLLAPDGSQVQCARCQAIFTARPPRPAAAPPPEPPPAAPPPPPVPAPAPAAPPSAPPAHRPAGPAQSRQRTAAPVPAPAPVAEPPPRSARVQEPAAAGPEAGAERPVRTTPQRQTRPGPAVYRAPPQGAKPSRPGHRSALRPGPQPEPRKPMALIAFGAVVAVLLLAGAWSLWRRKPDADVGRQAAEAAARLALDDATSLARAVQLYDGLLAKAPSQADAEVERAVARLLMAAGQQDEAEPFATQLAANTVDRSQLDRERPPGSDAALRALASEAARLEAELAPRRKAAEVLLAQASVELRTLATGPDREALAARGLVLQAALAGDRAEVDRLVPLARAAGPSPWPALAQAWVELRGSGSRELAMTRLAELVKARPELLRARYLLARAQAASGRHDEALSTLALLLAANPRHERALRLQGQLAAPPVPKAPAPGPPAAAPPPAGAAPPVDATASQPAPAAGGTPPAAGEASPGPSAPTAPPRDAPAPPRPAPARGPGPLATPPRAAPPPPSGPAAVAAPARPATAPTGPPAVAPGVDASGAVLLPAPTRIEVARPGGKAANIDAGTVQPLPSEPAAPPPARP